MGARTFFSCRAKCPDFKIEEGVNSHGKRFMNATWTQFGMPFQLVMFEDDGDRMTLIGLCFESMREVETNPPLVMIRDGVRYESTFRPVDTTPVKKKSRERKRT